MLTIGIMHCSSFSNGVYGNCHGSLLSHHQRDRPSSPRPTEELSHSSRVGICNHGHTARLPLTKKLRQLGDVRCNLSPLSSDTSHVAGNRHTEEKHEHTN